MFRDKTSGKYRLALSEQVLVALVLGIAAGVFFGEMTSWLKIVGDIFIKLLQITVIPYISLSLITGLGQLSIKEIKKLAVTGGSILLLTWVVVITLVVFAPLSFPNWPTASFFSTSLVEEGTSPDFLKLFIPSNPFYAYSNAIVPAVVVFSILIGVALVGVKNNKSLLKPLIAASDALIKVTSMVSKLAPIGVFALIAYTIGTISIEDLTRLQVFIVVYVLLALILGLWILPAAISCLTPFRYTDVLRALRTPLITAFATGSSLVVVPMLIEQCKQLIAESKSLNAEKQEQAESSVEVLIPTVYPFPSPGVVLTLSFVLFSGWYIGSDVSISDYPTLIIAGLPSLFAGTLITMPFLLDLVRLPSDMYQVFISIDVITTRFSTFVAAMHYAAVGLIGSMAMARKLRVRWLSLLKVSLVGVVLISVVLVGVRSFYSHIVVAPYTIADALRGFQFLVKPQPSTIYDGPVADNQQAKPVGLSEIEKRGVLRICYQPDEYPSSFFNTNTPADLVGFDIEMAHRFAQELELPIEFHPAADEKQAAQKLNHGICDIYMRTLLIATDRARLFALTTPVYSSALGLIVKDYQRDQLRDWSTVKNQKESLRLGVENSPGAIRLLKSLAPEAILVPIQNIQEQMEMLEAGTPGIDAISDMAEEGAAQTLLYPSYSVVIPKPVISIPVAYAVAKNNDDLLIALNAWIVAEKSKGTVARLYQHWMLGEALQAKRIPRWSVIKDVLGWAE